MAESKKAKKITSKSNKHRPISINEFEINKNSRYVINHALPKENDNGIVNILWCYLVYWSNYEFECRK